MAAMLGGGQLGVFPAGLVQAGPSCSISHLDDIISAILAVDSLDSTYVQAAEHF